MDSFGFGTFNTNVGANMPIPKNPLDKERSCGGSSGGAGAATLAIKMLMLRLENLPEEV